MENVATYRRVLDFLQKRGGSPFVTGDFQLHQNVFARGMAEHGINVACGNLERLGLFFSAVKKATNNAPSLQSARSRTSSRSTTVCPEVNLLCQVRYMSIL